MMATLEAELRQLDRRIACLTRNRDAVAEYVEAVRTHRPDGPAGLPPDGPNSAGRPLDRRSPG
jgi:hypothetical protein